MNHRYWLIPLIGIAILAYYLKVEPLPDLCFESVFSETTGEKFERQILEEINADWDMRTTKLGLFKETPLYLFYAVSPPLSWSGSFNCKVICRQPFGEMKVHLYVRQKDGKYREIHEDGPLRFQVQGSAGDRIVAMGTLVRKDGDFNKLIALGK